nr:ribonuclease H-like domain-containing protein [Tanacetum cinerariifolium]
MKKLGEENMGWEKEKPTKTLTTIASSFVTRRLFLSVGIKGLHGVFTAQLVLLVYKVTTVFNKVIAARVTTTDRVTTAGWIKTEMKIRIEQYFLMTDYAFWEVILNGDSPPQIRSVDGVETPYPPTTVDEKLARQNELKTRGTLLMALLNEHQLKFNSYKNAKSLMEAIEKSSEGLDQIYDRLQKLISHLEVHGETISQEDMNLKLLRINTAHGVSAPSSKTNASNLPNVDSLSDAMIYSLFSSQSNSSQLDNEDLKQIDSNDFEEIDLKWQMEMLTMRARRFLQKTGMNLGVKGTETIGFDKNKVKCYNCHIRGHFTRECKASKHQDNRNRETTTRTMPVHETTSNSLVTQCDGLGYYWSDHDEDGPTNFVLMAYASSSSSSSDYEVSSCSKACLKSYETLKEYYDNLTKDFNNSQFNLCAYKAGLESVEARLEVYKNNEIVNIYKSKTGLGYDSQGFDSQVLDNQVNDKSNTCEGYHAVPPSYTGNFMPLKPDLVFANEHVVSEYVTSLPGIAKIKVKTSESKPKTISAPIIKDWVFDSEDENEIKTETKQIKPSFAKVKFVKPTEHVKSPRKSVKQEESNKQTKYPRKTSQSPRGNQRNRNNLMTQRLGDNFEFKNKACYKCASFNHLIKDCASYKKKIVKKPIWNNAKRVNHQNSQRLSHPYSKRNFVPKAILTNSGLKTLNIDRQTSSRAAMAWVPKRS